MKSLLSSICLMVIAFLPQSMQGINVKGWILLSDNMEYAQRSISTAKEYGVNQLQLSHNIIHNLKEIKDEKVCAKVNRLIDVAHQKGIGEVLLWDHCLYSLDYYPDRFKLKDSGLLDLDNPDFWAWLKEDYRQMLRKAEKADGLVLTFIETGAYAEKQHSSQMKTPQEKLAAVVNAVADVVVGEFKKKLYIRTFAYSTEEYENIMGCINLIHHTYLTASLHEAVATVYFGKRTCESKYGSPSPRIRQDIQSAIARIRQIANEMKQLTGTFPIGQYNWGHDADVALKNIP